jgi:hypothetical protein
MDPNPSMPFCFSVNAQKLFVDCIGDRSNIDKQFTSDRMETMLLQAQLMDVTQLGV